jgi:hypothetical protein
MGRFTELDVTIGRKEGKRKIWCCINRQTLLGSETWFAVLTKFVKIVIFKFAYWAN